MHPWKLLKEIAFLAFVIVLVTLYMCKITTLAGMIRARMMGHQWQWVLPEEQNGLQAESAAVQPDAHSLAVPFFSAQCSVLGAYLRDWLDSASSDQ